MKNQSIELSKVKASYTHSLAKNLNEINRKYADKSVSTYYFKNYIKNLVLETNDKSIDDKSPATKRFLASLENQKSKDQIITLVYNTYCKADGLGVI